ncbi:MAG: endonuclease, partial [Anaeroplasmataceae bacterium]|nr:endonuclease [Anaeroplasmataceae bacterium]
SGSWNKEHVWAKSHGFGTESWDPYSDAHHLRPTLNSINSSRSNSDFGELDGVSGVKSDNFGNRWTGDTFEPRDEVKGDVARMMFYMATRYGFTAPYNLKLVNDAHTSLSKEGNGRFGNLQTLLKWHYEDPVSDAEIYRNNVIYQDWQHNRNPYIDHPEYVDLAWPNSYSSQEVDEAKVYNAIELIGSIPSVLTLDDKATVTAAKNAYDALNFNEKKLVVNYAELEKALNKMQELEGPSTPVDPDPTNPDNPVLTNGVTVDFANHGLGSTGYSTDFNGNVDGKPFYISHYGVFPELRIGSNKAAGTINSKYGLNSVSGVVLEQKFDVENSKSLTLKISGHYGTLSEYYILFQETGSNSYSLVTHQNASWSDSISASLLEAKSGHFVVVFVGSTPRAVLSSYVVGIADKTPAFDVMNAIENSTVSSSVLATFDENSQITWAGLRFGGRFDKRIFENATNYGVAIMDSNDFGNSNIAELYEGGSAEDYFEELKDSGFASLSWNFKEDRAIVNEQGKLDADGDYIQFGLIVNDILTHEDFVFRAVIYVEIDGVVYFMNETETCFIDACFDYVESDTITNSEKEILNNYLEEYFA